MKHRFNATTTLPLACFALLQRQPGIAYQFWQDFGRKQDGASVVLFILIFAVLLGFGGLAIDGSNVYFNQQRMQIAADAAALAGTRLVSQDASHEEVDGEIHELAYANDADTVGWTYIKDSHGVHVEVSRDLAAFFARIYGHSHFTVRAEAAAQYEFVTSAGGLMPFTIFCNPWDGLENAPDEVDGDCEDGVGFEYGKEYTLHEPEQNAPGNFGWLRWEGDTTSLVDLEYNINYPEQSPVLSIGDWVQGTSGMKTPAFSVLDQWLDKLVIIPIYDQVIGTGSKAEYRIFTFGVFRLTTYDKQAKTITGQFVRALVHSSESVEDGPDLGARDIRLVQ